MAFDYRALWLVGQLPRPSVIQLIYLTRPLERSDCLPSLAVPEVKKETLSSLRIFHESPRRRLAVCLLSVISLVVIGLLWNFSPSVGYKIGSTVSCVVTVIELLSVAKGTSSRLLWAPARDQGLHVATGLLRICPTIQFTSNAFWMWVMLSARGGGYYLVMALVTTLLALSTGPLATVNSCSDAALNLANELELLYPDAGASKTLKTSQ